jgi:hypothetical protein
LLQADGPHFFVRIADQIGDQLQQVGVGGVGGKQGGGSAMPPHRIAARHTVPRIRFEE